jgi:aldehyde dehydrogenase (NAD+)
MQKEELPAKLEGIKVWFKTGATTSYQFRRQQLMNLKAAVQKYEKEIHDALYNDLKKSPEEAYATETGLVLGEINFVLKHLRKWMQPQNVATDLVNLPSESKIYRDPLGVVLIIAPFNYPMQLLLKPLVGAIAGGNCAVLKPSELTPATTAVVRKIISETFSEDYILVVEGDGAEMVPAMLNAFRFDHIFYTGSTTVGKIIYKQAAEQLIPVTLELGGKSPCILEDGADLKIAARRTAIGKFTNTGQTCIAPDYVLLKPEMKKPFIEHFVAAIEKFYSADPSSSHEYGKIINERQFDRLSGYLQHAKVVYGGKHDRSNLYISPTIIDDVDEQSDLMKQEIFGPLLPILTYTNTSEAMSIVERNPNPLAFYLFTSNKEVEKAWIEKIRFGSGCINNTVWHFTNPHLPFGGVGYSGLGAYHGKYSFHTFTRAKSVMKTPTWFDPSIKYPPLKGKLKLFKWVIR